MKSEHHSNSPSAGTGCSRAPSMSSSLRLVSCVRATLLPEAGTGALPPGTCRWPSPVSLFQSQGLKPWPQSSRPSRSRPWPWPLLCMAPPCCFRLGVSCVSPGGLCSPLAWRLATWDPRKSCALVFPVPDPDPQAAPLNPALCSHPQDPAVCTFPACVSPVVPSAPGLSQRVRGPSPVPPGTLCWRLVTLAPPSFSLPLWFFQMW